MFGMHTITILVSLAGWDSTTLVLGNTHSLGPESRLSRPDAGFVTVRIEPFVLAFADNETDKKSEEKTDSNAKSDAASNRGGLTEFQEKSIIVAAALIIAFVIAWKLAARSQEDIQRLLKKSKRSTDTEDSPQIPEAGASASQTETVKSDTALEIPVQTGDDTDPEIPVSNSL